MTRRGIAEAVYARLKVIPSLRVEPIEEGCSRPLTGATYIIRTADDQDVPVRIVIEEDDYA